MEKFYQLGKLIFKLSGDGIIHQHIAEELSSISIDKSDSYQLEFKFVKTLPEFNDYVLFPPVLTSPTKFQFQRNNFTYQVSKEEQKTLVVLKPTLKLKFTEKVLPDNLIKAKD